MPKDHSAIGVTHTRVYEGEDLDPSQVAQISWCQGVRVLIRPLGQKTVFWSSEDQFTVTSSAGIRNCEKRTADTVVRELKGPNLARGRAYRLAKCGQLRRRLTFGLDTSGSGSSGRFLVA